MAFNSGWFDRNPEEAPIIYRPPVDPLARNFVYFFAIAPALAGSLISGLFDLDRVVGGSGVALLMSGLAVIVATGDLVHLRRQRAAALGLGGRDRAPALAVHRRHAVPALDRRRRGGDVAAGDARSGSFFGDSFERRTNQPLRAVSRRSAARQPDRARHRHVRICFSTPRRSGRRG